MKKYLQKLIGADFLVGEHSGRNWRMTVMAGLLFIIQVQCSHLAQEKVSRINKLNDEIQELKSEFVSVRSELQNIRLESNLVEALKKRGITPSKEPPQRIKVIVKKEE